MKTLDNPILSASFARVRNYCFPESGSAPVMAHVRTVAVRRASPSHAAAIASVHIRGWQAAYRGQLPDSFLDQLSSELASRTEFWKTHLTTPSSPKHEIWVAAVGDQVRGFSALGPSRDSEPSQGELYAIYIDPNFWGRGFGRLLLTQCVERLAALKFSAANLWVLASNARSRRFYERAGWAADGRSKVESTTDGVELREVSYRISLAIQEAS